MRSIQARAFLAATASLSLLSVPASADTLQQALIEAYKTNPTLSAQRAALRAADENVPIARSQALPNIGVQGGFSENFVTSANNFVAPARQVTAQSSMSFPVFSGGAISNAVKAAKTRVEAGRANLRGTEADLFSAVVRAYMDVIRDEAIVGLNQQNVRVLDVNLQASRDRFQVGDLTRTDVAQSEARLSLARAQLQSAEAQLISSRETYIRLVGAPPGILDTPPDLPNLPENPDVAVQVALGDNPQLEAAKKALEATGYDIAVARASRSPQVGLQIGGAYQNYLGTLGGQNLPDGSGPLQAFTQAQAGVNVTVPLYQGGRPAAQIRQAQALRSQSLEQLTEAERNVIAQARSAYAVWRSSLQVIDSSAAAVAANRLSLEGVRAENSVGNRTILEILNAEQELLNSQVTLVSARRDAYVAGFTLLAAMGKAEANDLRLDGGPLYDPLVNYKRVQGRFLDYGTDPAPAPVATSTAGTPAQGSEVRRPLDPQLDAPVDRGSADPAGVVPKPKKR